MTRALLTPEADADIDDIVTWLAARSPNAADRASEALFKAINLLRDQPQLGPAKSADERELYVGFGLFGFVIRYKVAEDVVIIQRVFHGAQDR